MFRNTFVIACVATAASASNFKQGPAHFKQEDGKKFNLGELAQEGEFASSAFLNSELAQEKKETPPDQINSEISIPTGGVGGQLSQIQSDPINSEISASTGGKLSQIKTREGEINHANSGSEEESSNPNGMSLAQAQTFLSADQTTHTCSYSQDRNKNLLVDFETILNGPDKFTDAEFYPDTDALYWEDMGEHLGGTNEIQWRRAKEAFPNHTFLGNGISPDDINQGGLGNCWFLAAASAVADAPGRLEKIFGNQDTELNENGIYAFKFYALGVPMSIIIDDYLPVIKDGVNSWRTKFTGPGKYDNSLWGVLLEKAFAKYHGNYEHTNGGSSGTAVRTLSGAPKFMYGHRDRTPEELWDLIVNHDQTNDIMTASNGGHAYALLGHAVLSNGVKLVKLRNPWSSEAWSGDWSRDSDLWTDEFKQEVGEVGENDGIFFISIEDYYSEWKLTTINLDTENMHEAHFLKLNDTTAPNGGYSGCGSTCTRHKIRLTSEVAQTVFIEAHTWDNRQNSDDKCKQGHDKTNYLDNHAIWRKFGFSDTTQTTVDLRAGQRTDFTIEMDFSSPGKVADWSFVAYGPDGPVSITVDGFDKSDEFPALGGADGFADFTPMPEIEEKAHEELSAEDLLKVKADFVDIMDGFNRSPGGCGTSWRTSSYDGPDGKQRDYFLYHLGCDFRLQKQVTVYASDDDWENGVETFYSDVDGEGNLIADAVQTGCERSTEDPTQLGCTFLVGQILQYGDHGLAQELNPKLGIMWKPHRTGKTGLSTTKTYL